MLDVLEGLRRQGAEVEWGDVTWFVALATEAALWLCPYRYCSVVHHDHIGVPTDWFKWDEREVRLRPIFGRTRRT